MSLILSCYVKSHMWKPVGDSTGQCCTSLESTGHHIMRYPKRWPPPPKAAATFMAGRPKPVPHYVVNCGFERGAALASAVPHWFPRERLNIFHYIPYTPYTYILPLYIYPISPICRMTRFLALFILPTVSWQLSALTPCCALSTPDHQGLWAAG